MRLLRVEVWRAGEFIEGRTFPNPIAAQGFAKRRRATGDSAIVMFPRAERS